MNRLFTVRKPNGKLISRKGQVIYFANKMEAKAERNSRNEEKEGHSIAAGPDHWRYKHEY